jgi:hypothetical protein
MVHYLVHFILLDTRSGNICRGLQIMEVIITSSWRVQPPVISPLTFKQLLGTLFSKHLICGLPLIYERNSDITYSAYFELNCSFTTPTKALLTYKHTCKIVFLYIKGTLVAVAEWTVVRDKISHKTNIRETTGKENKTGNTTVLQGVRQCSVVHTHGHLKGTSCLRHQGRGVKHVPWCWMRYFFKTYQTTRRHILEDDL